VLLTTTGGDVAKETGMVSAEVLVTNTLETAAKETGTVFAVVLVTKTSDTPVVEPTVTGTGFADVFCTITDIES
jgi:hypothetical protein